MDSGKLLVFFDGRCPFCVGWVKFLLDRDGHDRLRFASLQSDWTRRFFAERNLAHPGTGSVVVWDGRWLFQESEAVAEMAAALPGIWRLLHWSRRLPRRWRDGAYRFVARRRHDWFGTYRSCWLPDRRERGKFLDLDDPVYQGGPDGTASNDHSGANKG
jgi:predicted DCC family thiol-disulfide oxidoreductase YuxK